jgi:hypothetical protein
VGNERLAAVGELGVQMVRMAGDSLCFIESGRRV